MRLVSFNVNGWPPTADNAALSVTSASAKSAAAAAASKAAKDNATSAGLARWIGERLGADAMRGGDAVKAGIEAGNINISSGQ